MTNALKYIEDMKLNKFTKFFYKHRPKLLFMDAADEIGLDHKKIENLHDVFSKAESIEVQPLSGKDDFQIIIDKKITLFFYARGNNQYDYDGFEIGDYGK